MGTGHVCRVTLGRSVLLPGVVLPARRLANRLQGEVEGEPRCAPHPFPLPPSWAARGARESSATALMAE